MSYNKLYTQGGSRSYDPNRKPCKNNSENALLGSMGFVLGCVVGAVVATVFYAVCLGVARAYMSMLIRAFGG